MIQILKYTEYVYLAVAILSGYKIFELWEEGGRRLLLFLFFMIISLFMFFFRRRMRIRMEERVRDNTP